MTDTIAAPTASDTITVIEGFDAMRVFLMTVCRRHGKTPQDIAFVLGGSKWADGTPADPEIWEDWLMAVRASRTAAEGTQLGA
jgi:hypothetical protein